MEKKEKKSKVHLTIGFWICLFFVGCGQSKFETIRSSTSEASNPGIYSVPKGSIVNNSNRNINTGSTDSQSGQEVTQNVPSPIKVGEDPRIKNTESYPQNSGNLPSQGDQRSDMGSNNSQLPRREVLDEVLECNNSEKFGCFGGTLGPGNGQTACGTTLEWTCVGSYGASVKCSRPNDFCPTTCSAMTDGYALCPVRPALLPNGRPSESTLVKACLGGMGKIVASSGNFSIIRTNQSDNGIPGSNLYLKTVDKSGVVVGNGASLMSPGDVASALVLSGLYQSDEWRSNFRELARQLDDKKILFRPDRSIRRGSDMGIDLIELANNRMGGAYDWTSDANTPCKGPTALRSLKNLQIVASLLKISNANSGLLGQNVPSYVSQAIGEGPGGVVCYKMKTIPGLSDAMLTKSGNIMGVLSASDIAEFFKLSSFDLFKNDYLPSH